MKFLFQIKNVINKCYVLQCMYDISKSFILFVPFYLMKECLDNQNNIDVKPKLSFDSWELVFLGPPDMEKVSKTPGVREDKYELQKRLDEGCLCLGLKNGSIIIAHMWCNLSKCDSKLLTFSLNQNEAYLTDARTIEEYRGKNIAPFLRYQFYKHLKALGRTELYSITEYFNKPAMKFKEKLGARPWRLYLYLCFLKKYSALILLRQF